MARFSLLCLSLCASPYVLAQEGQLPVSASTDGATTGAIEQVVVVATGSRGAQRTLTDTAVPVDILSARDINRTGQTTLDKALQFSVPSFNTVQSPVSDAASLLDTYEIRNLGPSRTLILINGKRKNASSLIYTTMVPGRGEGGADLSAIPVDAIKRIEVLRDGASAQYGSDAIAGVVNIILKDNAEGGSLTARGGVTHEGDGKSGDLSLNHGLALGDRGFVNYTLDVSKTTRANRPGVVDARGEAGDFGADLNTQVLPFLAAHPDAGNYNGGPPTRAAKAEVNARYDLGEATSLYGNAAYVNKKVDSVANYRTPYWKPTDYGLLHAPGTPYEGYRPAFIGTLDDYNATVGIKSTIGGWNTDLSLTYGGNRQDYEVSNTLNLGLQEDFLAHKVATASPTRFDAGAVKFSHWVLNGDISNQLTPGVNVYAGTELRHEVFDSIAGDPASYYGSGADSYAGNSAANALSASRSNYGVYAGAAWDITPAWLIDGTGRYEHYSDFGSAFVWKAASRYKFSERFTLRGSVSTGFRAPSLAQIYTQRTQYLFTAGQGVQVSGLVNNVSAAAAALGVPKLKAEKSDNVTLGFGFKPDSDTTITVDYYNIKVKDRVVLSTNIVPSGNAANPLDVQLNGAGIRSASFFVNALTSRTAGIDYVLSRKNLAFAGGRATLNLSGNYTLKNDRQGAADNPALVAAAGQSVLNPTTEALMFTSRPKFKTILGAEWAYRNWNLALNNTVFGPTRFRNAGMDENLEVALKTKSVTDFAATLQLTKNTVLSFNLNNAFNVLPSWHFNALNAKGQALLASTALDPTYQLTPAEIQRNLVTFNGRYPTVTYDGSQFSELGRSVAASINYRF